MRRDARAARLAPRRAYHTLEAPTLAMARGSPTASHPSLQKGDEVDGTFCDAHACRLERCDFFSRGSCGTADNRASVTHATSGRRRLSRDEPHDRLGHVVLHELGGVL